MKKIILFLMMLILSPAAFASGLGPLFTYEGVLTDTSATAITST